MRPFFSVIICSYNRAAYLPRALDSLIGQRATDWEAVIIDDGSTDHTIDIVSQYKNVDSRLRFHRHPENLGLSNARNRGVREAKGQFITFLDSDDEYAKDHLENRQTILEKDPSIRFIHGGVTVIGDPFVIDKNSPTERIHIDQCVIGGTFFIRRDVFEIVKEFQDVDYAEDALFFEQITAAGIQPAKTHHPSYIYYRNIPNQITSSFPSEKKDR